MDGWAIDLDFVCIAWRVYQTAGCRWEIKKVWWWFKLVGCDALPACGFLFSSCCALCLTILLSHPSDPLRFSISSFEEDGGLSRRNTSFRQRNGLRLF